LNEAIKQAFWNVAVVFWSSAKCRKIDAKRSNSLDIYPFISHRSSPNQIALRFHEFEFLVPKFTTSK
jgi:hypothetical protein